jgi:hypothetical protein
MWSVEHRWPFHRKELAATTMDLNESKPCCPPLESVPSVEPLRRRFPWRIIPVALLYAHGGLAVLIGTTQWLLIRAGCSMVVDGNHFASVAQLNVIMWMMALGSIHGCFAIAAGQNVWKRRWKRSVIYLVGALVFAIAVTMESHVVHGLPPGRQTSPFPKSSSLKSDRGVSEGAGHDDRNGTPLRP